MLPCAVCMCVLLLLLMSSNEMCWVAVRHKRGWPACTHVVCVQCHWCDFDSPLSHCLFVVDTPSCRWYSDQCHGATIECNTAPFHHPQWRTSTMVHRPTTTATHNYHHYHSLFHNDIFHRKKRSTQTLQSSPSHVSQMNIPLNLLKIGPIVLLLF